MLIGSLQTYSFEEACGAYIVAGVLCLLLGLSGLIGKVMRLLPLPIVQGMIAGCMMRFGIDIVLQTKAAPYIGAATLAGYFLAPKFHKKAPAVLIGLICGIVAASFTGSFSFDVSNVVWSGPHIYMPKFTISSILSIGVPLAVLVIGAENAQAIGVLFGQGYKPPVNAMTVWSGIGGILSGLFGAHNANIAGPMTAICSSDEADPDKNKRYTGSVINGAIFAAFGLLGPVAIVFVASMPKALVGLVAGLAMVNVLIQSLKDGFATGNYRFGAFAAFVIGMSGLTLFQIGSPLWALVGGMAVSGLMEPSHFKTAPAQA
jgi:benzoate membrane transport protein